MFIKIPAFFSLKISHPYVQTDYSRFAQFLDDALKKKRCILVIDKLIDLNKQNYFCLPYKKMKIFKTFTNQDQLT